MRIPGTVLGTVCVLTAFLGMVLAEPPSDRSPVEDRCATSKGKALVGHPSPEAAFLAFQTAARAEDWAAALRSCATSLQDHLVMTNTILGYRLAARVRGLAEPFEKIVRRYVPRLEELKTRATDEAKALGRKPTEAELAAKILAELKDKPGYLAELFVWLQSKGIGHNLPADAVAEAALKDLKIRAAEADGVAVTGEADDRVDFPVKFVRETDGWRILLPAL